MESPEPPDLLENLLHVLNDSSSNSTPNSKSMSKPSSKANSPTVSTAAVETIQEPTTPQISSEITTSSQVNTPLARFIRDRFSPLPPNTPTGPKALIPLGRGTSSSPKHPKPITKPKYSKGSPLLTPTEKRNSGQTTERPPLFRRTGTIYDGRYRSPKIYRIIDHWSPRSRRRERKQEDRAASPSRTPTPRLHYSSTNVSSYSSPIRSSSSHKRAPVRKEEFALLSPVSLICNEDVKKDACYNCGRKGHWFMDCVVNCGRCGEDGHRTIDCIVIGRKGKGLGENMT